MANTHPKLIEDVADQTPKAMIAMLTVSIMPKRLKSTC